MAENSKIEWTTHTANLWWGCQKVNPACDFCYAENMSRRYDGKGEDGQSAIWGPKSKRKPIKSWLSSLDKFQRKAANAGENHRVFVGSMMDIFEVSKPLTEEWEYQYEGGKGWLFHTEDVRGHFFHLINSGGWPNLTFLLLTKRPGNIPKMVPPSWLKNCPENVWFGCSIPNQECADRDIPKLLEAPGTGNKFLSMEPLLGPVNLYSRNLATDGWMPSYYDPDNMGMEPEAEPLFGGISWVIVGGESGPNARPMHPDWVRSLRDQCEGAGVPFFFKQWGEWGPESETLLHPNRYNMEMMVYRVGKKAAGRLLDGLEWNETPFD